MMGKPQPLIFVRAIAKIWPSLIDGISKLDFKNDPNLNKNLTDLIVKWTPHFKVENTSKVVAQPFIKVTNLRNRDVVSLMWEKLSKSFIALQNRQPHANSCMVRLYFFGF
jgi:hypothetical protein